jgi:two-component system sensor histidine kinase QseC
MRILAGTLVLSLAAGAGFFAFIHRQLVQDFDRALDAEVEMLIRSTERKGRTIVWDVPDAYLSGKRQNAAPPYCQLFLEDGTVAGLSQTLGADDLPRLDGQPFAAWNAPLPDGRRGRLMQKIFVPHADDSEVQTGPEDPNEQTFEIPERLNPSEVRLVLVVARSRTKLDAVIRTLGLAGATVAVLLSCALAWLVRRSVIRGLQPIVEMNTQIAAIAPDSLASRLAVAEPPVELAAIETAVNRLLQRLEGAFERERRFSSDLAHELRTPIAELCTACEVAERCHDDPRATRQFFRDVRETALHLEKLVATMLTLSRCEAGSLPLQRRRIGVRSFVSECWRHSAAAADAKRLQFAASIASDLTVECDEEKLGILVRNLLENAVTHSPPGESVECSAGPKGDGAELRIANTAQDLDPADLVHVFDRFWRKDSSRTDRRHAGLGLPIARELSTMLGLKLEVDLRDGQLFEARLFFPSLSRG